MLKKFLKVHSLTPFPRPKPPKPASAEVKKDSSSTVLKIVHVGGNVKCYYMAIPAARIMEKYPSFLLARPDVFRWPWDSVVSPDEILNPGEKFFVVSHRTVRKLQRRISKPSTENSVNSLISQSSNNVSAEIVSLQKDGISSDLINTCFSASRKKSGCKKHVTFRGIDVKRKVGTCMGEKKGKEGDNARKSLNPKSKSHGEKRRVWNVVTWQPSLTAISESQGNDE